MNWKNKNTILERKTDDIIKEKFIKIGIVWILQMKEFETYYSNFFHNQTLSYQQFDNFLNTIYALLENNVYTFRISNLDIIDEDMLDQLIAFVKDRKEYAIKEIRVLWEELFDSLSSYDFEFYNSYAVSEVMQKQIQEYQESLKYDFIQYLVSLQFEQLTTHFSKLVHKKLTNWQK